MPFDAKRIVYGGFSVRIDFAAKQGCADDRRVAPPASYVRWRMWRGGAADQISSMSSHLVLLHGLGRTAHSMAPVAREASKRGYSVLNLGYPSRTARVADLAEHVAHAVQQFAPEAPALDFVTHSLGGILLRAAVGAGLIPLERVRRAVLLAPPNQGSEAADFMTRVPLLGRVPGLPLAELGIDADGVVARLGPVPFECGVIAGNRTVNPILSLVIPGPDDGKVAIARASAAGIRDFLVVPHSHPFIMRAAAVHRQIFHFLAHGRFDVRILRVSSHTG